CQGRPLRSRERTLRGLDSAVGGALGTAMKGICFFFSSGNHARKREKEENEMTEKQHATWGELLQDAVEKPGRLLEAYTAFYNFSFGHSTPIAGGLNGNGKYAKGNRELLFACPCRSKGKRNPMAPEMTQQNHKHAMPSGFGRIGSCSHRPREKTPSFRRF